jgi:hypothetical protein
MSMLNFLRRDFLAMNLMCERAQMFEERIYDRSKGVERSAIGSERPATGFSPAAKSTLQKPL